jgi:hypothetical protein
LGRAINFLFYITLAISLLGIALPLAIFAWPRVPELRESLEKFSLADHQTFEQVVRFSERFSGSFPIASSLLPINYPDCRTQSHITASNNIPIFGALSKNSVHFSVPIILKKNLNLICQSPGTGGPVTMSPALDQSPWTRVNQDATQIIVIRQSEKPILVDVLSGQLDIRSEKLQLTLRLGSHELNLTSTGPVMFRVAVLEKGLSFGLQLAAGTFLSAKSTKKSNSATSAGSSVMFSSFMDGLVQVDEIEMRGEKSQIRLLPSGPIKVD